MKSFQHHARHPILLAILASAVLWSATGAVGFGAAPIGEGSLANFVSTFDTNQTMTISFDIVGGINNAAYPILTCTNIAARSGAQWTVLASGYTGNHYTFANQPGLQAFYALGMPAGVTSSDAASGNAKPLKTQISSPTSTIQIFAPAKGVVTKTVLQPPSAPPNVVDWTRPTNQWVNYGSNLTLSVIVNDPVGVVPSSCRWQFYGTNLAPDMPGPFDYAILATGTNQAGIYSAVITNALGKKTMSWTVHPAYPGSVALWGTNNFGQTTRPAGLTNTIAVSAGPSNCVALLANGTVRQWGYNPVAMPANLTNIASVSAGPGHTLALKNDGTVVGWGTAGAATTAPANLTGVKAITAAANHNIVLLSNSTVKVWGLAGMSYSTAPAGLSNVIAVAAGAQHNLVLKSDGTVMAWGNDPHGQTNVPPGLSNVVAIAAGNEHSLALKADGTVVAWGYNNLGQCNVPFGLGNVIAISGGGVHSLALRSNGTIVGWGDNSAGQIDMTTNLFNVTSIAAGGRHSVASMAFSTTPAPPDPAQNLLLVYNSASSDSINVFNYYLKNRPGVSHANVLGINCTVGETILPQNFTNQILASINAWLAANPAKRPGYVVLFLDVPSRVNGDPNFPHYGNTAVFPSVSYQIATGITNWHPLITHINMGDTNACIAYVNKLAQLGTTAPNSLAISASAGGYGNNHYVIDGIRNGAGHVDNYTAAWWFMPSATNGLLPNGVPLSSISIADGTEIITNNIAINLPHLTSAANVAGYLSWGAHSSLGSLYATGTGGNACRWTGNSAWYLIETIESFNGRRYQTDFGTYVQWFSPNAFGGANYSNTPVGAVSNVDEPGLSGMNDPKAYFGSWAAGKNFATCAWNSRYTQYFQAVGDPFVCR